MVLTSDSGALRFLEELEQTLRRELLRTWREQGHFMNGAIVETAEFVINTTLNRLEFLLYIFPYGGYIETGVPAGKIPFSGTGNKGGTSKYIQALIGYAKKRMNLPDKEAKQVAFAIAHTQKKQGMPTRGSQKYSSTGKRIGWIQDTMDREQGTIERAMRNYVYVIFEGQLTNIITKYQREFLKRA